MRSASAATGALIPFEPAIEKDSDIYNAEGLRRISDAEHFERALASGAPHTYIAERAGHMNYEGEDGICTTHAIDMHVDLFMMPDHCPDPADIADARLKVSFRCAVEKLALRCDKTYTGLKAQMPPAFHVSKPPEPFR